MTEDEDENEKEAEYNRAINVSAILCGRGTTVLVGCSTLEDIRHVANLLVLSDVTELRFEKSYLGPEGGRVLADALPSTKIECLCLYRCALGDRGIIALAAALPLMPRLVELDVGENDIEDAGLLALAEALPHSRLTELTLGGFNFFTRGSFSVMIKAVPRSFLTELWMNTRDRDSVDETIKKALSRGHQNRQLMAFVQGILAEHTPIAKFLRRDGDTAAQHRVARFLITL